MNVVHIITGLGLGGAETMLHKVLSRTDRAAFTVEVISLSDIGPIGERIQQLGIPVSSAGFSTGRSAPAAIGRLVRMLRARRPDVVQTWMYHADLLGGIAARLAGVKAIAWNIRNSTLDAKTSKRSTIRIMQLCARLSARLPARIVTCSQTAKDLHVSQGYRASRFTVIPNGFDLAAFRPDPSARLDVRLELDVADDAPLIGLVGRYDPQKDHRTFVRAAARLASDRPDARFLMCGTNVSWDNEELAAEIDRCAPRETFRLLGRRGDVARLNAALDIGASSSSYGEAFSNALGEAMACGVPCVATDVGDAAYILGDTGVVTPRGDPEALSAGFAGLLAMPADERRNLGARARARVQERFDLPVVTERYQALYREIAQCAA